MSRVSVASSIWKLHVWDGVIVAANWGGCAADCIWTTRQAPLVPANSARPTPITATSAMPGLMMCTTDRKSTHDQVELGAWRRISTEQRVGLQSDEDLVAAALREFEIVAIVQLRSGGIPGHHRHQGDVRNDGVSVQEHVDRRRQVGDRGPGVGGFHLQTEVPN